MVKSFISKVSVFILFLLFFNCQRYTTGERASIAYKDELIKIELESLENRDNLFRTFSKYGVSSKQAKKQIKFLQKEDAKMLAKFYKLERKYGWPKLSEVGYHACQGAYFVIQHAENSSVRAAYLPIIEKSFHQNEFPGEFYATLLDRTLMDKKSKQIYGTQMVERRINDTLTIRTVWPIADFSNVDERRQKVGLNSFDEFLKKGDMEYHPEDSVYLLNK